MRGCCRSNRTGALPTPLDFQPKAKSPVCATLLFDVQCLPCGPASEGPPGGPSAENLQILTPNPRPGAGTECILVSGGPFCPQGRMPANVAPVSWLLPCRPSLLSARTSVKYSIKLSKIKYISMQHFSLD